MNWQPIETAPKDGSIIDILARGKRYTDCWWGRETYGKRIGWVYQGDYDSDGPVDEFIDDPTHWQPLPEPPTSQSPER